MESNKMYSEVVRMALKVDFLESKEEFDLYVNAICEAIKWGVNVQKNS